MHVQNPLTCKFKFALEFFEGLQFCHVTQYIRDYNFLRCLQEMKNQVLFARPAFSKKYHPRSTYQTADSNKSKHTLHYLK